MKFGKNRALKILVLIFIALTVLAVLPIPWPICPFWLNAAIFVKAHQTKLIQERLLCKTDHQNLLEACRDLSKQVIAGDIKPGKYWFKFPKRNPEVSRFPKAIRELAPNYVSLYKDGCVMVEMLGGLGHFGLMVYPDDYKKPLQSFKYGDRELIPGLWYYDDGYVRNPEYDKRIDELMQKNK